MTDMPEPAFSEPWHAQLFALTVHLSEVGRFEWPDWTARLSRTLAEHGLAKELNGGDDYFMAWLDALESILFDDGLTLPQEVYSMREAWRQAYLETPHGAPVTLND